MVYDLRQPSNRSDGHRSRLLTPKHTAAVRRRQISNWPQLCLLYLKLTQRHKLNPLTYYLPTVARSYNAEIYIRQNHIRNSNQVLKPNHGYLGHRKRAGNLSSIQRIRSQHLGWDEVLKWATWTGMHSDWHLKMWGAYDIS